MRVPRRGVISVAGSAHRSFTFPAPLDAAFRFNADLDGMLRLLPHIAVVDDTTPGRRRLCYRATEAGLYKVRVHCTVSAEVDAAAHEIRIRPLDDPARFRAGLRSMSGRGRYQSTIRFHADGASTRVEYALTISAEVPTPDSLRLLPEALVNFRATRRFRRRLREIVDGFIERSIAAYRAAGTESGTRSRTVPAPNDQRP